MRPVDQEDAIAEGPYLVPDARNIGRINVWRSHAVAADAATDDFEINVLNRMTVYSNRARARLHRHHEMPAPGGGGGYTASAVHFDGSAWLETVNLTAGAASPYIVGSFWIKQSAEDISGGYDYLGAGGSEPKLYAYSDGAGGLTIFVRANADGIDIISTAGAIVANTWTNIRFDVNTSTGAAHIFAGAADVTGSIIPNDVPIDFPANGLTIGFPDSTNGDYAAVADFADVWIAFGQNISMAVGAGGADFINGSGKPKNPSGFPAGGQLLFSGNATGFATNQGTGGAFVKTGTLTNASTSPSD